MFAKNKLVILAVVILLVAAWIFFSKKTPLRPSCDKYSCLSFPGNEKWKVKDIYSDTTTGWHGLISADGYDARLSLAKNIDENKAKELTQTSLMAINGLFDTAKNPYAGAISDKIVCPDDLKPSQEVLTGYSGIKVNYIESYLNDRLQYGACTESQITNKVFTGIFYCSTNKEWYELELITPKNNSKTADFYRGLFLQTTCKAP